ncbi:MAG: PD-(D/E)XK nuclease-like domain-containing protein [Alphaproteobacteria bacterium]|nr:PD-(D/E)XK nuclease-like domain-containing protein [Alphaproteobacteria bacterium]
MITDAEILDIDHRSYHNWPADIGKSPGDPTISLSRSQLMRMLDCGEMFLAGGRRPKSASLSIGSLVDCMLLTPDEFLNAYSIEPREYTKEVSKGRGANKTTEIERKVWTRQSNTCRAWIADQRDMGRIVISQREFDEAEQMVNAIRRTVVNGLSLGDLVDDCKTQVVLAGNWSCPDTGLVIPVRALPDMVRFADSGPVLYDLKTSAEVSKWEFERSVRKYHYDVQAWMYSELMRSATGIETPFGFVCVRNSKPYLVATYRVSLGTLRQGQDKFERAMSAYTRCLSTGKWNGYTNGFELI